MIYYSKSTKGFYHKEVHGDLIPEDCVEISKDLHEQLLLLQATGKYFIDDNNGTPFAKEVPQISYEESLKLFKKLSSKQLKFQLISYGLFDSVYKAIDSISDKTVALYVKVNYEESSTFSRTDEHTIKLLEALGMSSKDIDVFWEKALQII